MAFDLEGAKKAGANDEQIAEYLAKKRGFDIEGAKKAGASASAIVSHLMKKEGGAPAKAESEPKKQEAPQEPQEAPSLVAQMFGMGSPTARFIKGAVVDPLLGVNQLLANTGLFGDTVKQGATQNVRAYNQATDEARAAMGSRGFDPYQLAGAIASPINKAGLAQQGAKLGERALQGALVGTGQGLIVPSSAEDTDNQTGDRAVSAALGAAFGAALPGGAEGARQIWAVIKRLPITQAAKQRALQRHIGEMVPEDIRSEVTTAMREATPATEGRKLTVAETMADTPAGIPLIKEQDRALFANPEMARARDLENQQVTQKALEGEFGKAEDIPVAKEMRDIVTGSQRQQALDEANVYGQQVMPLEQGAARAEAGAEAQAAKQAQQTAVFEEGKPGWLTAGTEAKTAGEKAAKLKDKAEFQRSQAQSLKDQGFYPLETKGIIDKLDSELATPSAAVDDLLTNVLQTTRRKLINATDPDTGIIRSDVLYKVRRKINEDISQYLNGRTSTDAPKVEKKIREMIDAATEKAGGTNMWSQYLTEFGERSQQINQMELGQQLLGKLGVDSASGAQQAGQFVEAVNNAVATIKTISGRSYTNVEEFATPRQVNVLKSVVTDLKRKERAVLASRYGKQGEGVKNEAREYPSLLERSLVFTRAVLIALQNGSVKEFNAKIADLMLDPQKMADFIDSIPKDRSKEVVNLMTEKMSPDLRQSFGKFFTLQGGEQGVIRDLNEETTN